MEDKVYDLNMMNSTLQIEEASFDESFETNEQPEHFFINEIESRIKINSDNLEVFRNTLYSLKSKYDSGNVNEQKVEHCLNMYKNVHSVCCKSENLDESLNNLKKTIDTLRESIKTLNIKKGSEEEEIKRIQKETETGLNECKQLKLPFSKAQIMYSKHFDMDIQIKNLNDNTFEGLIHFSNNKNQNIKCIVDRTKNQIIDVDSSLSEDEEKLPNCDDFSKKITNLRKKILNMV